MPANVEIKARVRDPAALSAQVAALSEVPLETLEQEDTFYEVPSGRCQLSALQI